MLFPSVPIFDSSSYPPSFPLTPLRLSNTSMFQLYSNLGVAVVSYLPLRKTVSSARRYLTSSGKLPKFALLTGLQIPFCYQLAIGVLAFKRNIFWGVHYFIWLNGRFINNFISLIKRRQLTPKKGLLKS